MRGKEQETKAHSQRPGITPAYAGKSSTRKWREERARDHPRVCGEKNRGNNLKEDKMGSPPRMRGKEKGINFPASKVGITPAYAGKSTPSLSHRGSLRDHPRVCGEKARTLIVQNEPQGSPPRMRGKAFLRQCGYSLVGITPAYAGKRLKRSRSTVSPVAIVPLFPSVCNKPVVSDGSPAVRDAPLFLPAENAVPASPACNLRSL